MKFTVVRETKIARTARRQQLEGMFDVPPAESERLEWKVSIDLPAKWNVGVIVGASGTGKSTIAGELAQRLGGELLGGKNADGTDKPLWEWPADKSIVDGFPRAMPLKDITGLLSSVGFSSPPAWRRPFRVLSNGQQFRVNLARTLAELPALAVVDEFTSVVDRTVAKVGSAAVAKTVRRRGQKFIAVSCHHDIVDWLEPDWVLEVLPGGESEFSVQAGADAPSEVVRRLYRRPKIELQVVRVDRKAWSVFAPHHYLSRDLHRSSHCYCGFLNGTPAVFTAVLSFPHAVRPGWREHRTVCDPNFQGVGIGNQFSEFIASLYVATGKPYYSTTSHPAMIRHRARSPLWTMKRAPGINRSHSGGGSVGMAAASSVDRLTAGFEYVGSPRRDDARTFGIPNV